MFLFHSQGVASVKFVFAPYKAPRASGPPSILASLLEVEKWTTRGYWPRNVILASWAKSYFSVFWWVFLVKRCVSTPFPRVRLFLSATGTRWSDVWCVIEKPGLYMFYTIIAAPLPASCSSVNINKYFSCNCLRVSVLVVHFIDARCMRFYGHI